MGANFTDYVDGRLHIWEPTAYFDDVLLSRWCEHSGCRPQDGFQIAVMRLTAPGREPTSTLPSPAADSGSVVVRFEYVEFPEQSGACSGPCTQRAGARSHELPAF